MERSSSDEPPPDTQPPGAAPRRPAEREGARPHVSASDAGDLHVPNEDVHVAELVQNVEEVVIRITQDRLQGHLESFSRGLRARYTRQHRFQAPVTWLGLALALGLPLISANFKSYIFPAAVWQALCVLGTVACFLMCAYSGVRAFSVRSRQKRDPDSVEAALHEIKHTRKPPASL